MTILLTFDIEDWFQVENLRPAYPHAVWDRQTWRVEASTHALLDLLDEAAADAGAPVRATFFVLGSVAERFPRLVRTIRDRGHEVASHGQWHRLCPEEQNLAEDLACSRKLLEDILGESIQGYRAPGFSITQAALDQVRRAGYRYDSSYNSFALNPRHGALALNGNRCGAVYRIHPDFFEIPVSNLEMGRLVAPCAGGGYFRLIPLPLFIGGVRRILRRQGAYVFYAHPWELDPGQPRARGLSPLARFRHYCNLDQTARRLRHLIRAFSSCRFLTCSEMVIRSLGH